VESSEKWSFIMARITDANLAFVGQEPKFSVELSSIDMIKTLSWYSQNKDTKDAVKWATEYFKKKQKLDVSSVIKTYPSTFGFICRIVLNGGQLCMKDQLWFDGMISQIKDKLNEPVIVVEDKPKAVVINIQERIRAKADDCIAELEGQVDDLISSGFSANSQPYAVFHTMGIKDAQTKFITEWAKSKRIEFDEVMNTDDKELKDAYSNFTKPQLKKMVAYFDQVILDCQKVSGQSIKSRKPRKRKAKSPEQLTAKINFMPEFKELSLTSVKPTDIIGCMVLWVYNTKTRKLGVYHAEDAGGLSVKGSSILNFVESKSIQKKLRKPEQMLPDVLSGGKVFLRNVMEGIRAVESKLTGRINGDTILLKVVK
jgi:hypothetical protein